MSINLRQILNDRPLLGRAAQTLIFFALPSIFALLLVLPDQSRAALGSELIATGVFAAATALVVDYRTGPAWWPRAAGGLYWLVPAATFTIVAGLINTWVLLIEILR